MPDQKFNDDSAIIERDERTFFAQFGVEVDRPTTPHPPETRPEKFSPPVKFTAQSKTLSWRSVHLFLSRQIAIEEANDTLFLMVPILLIGGIATYFALPVEPAVHNIPVAMVALVVLRVLCRHAVRIVQQVLNALIIFVFAMGLSQARTFVLDTPMLGSEVSTRLTGRIMRIEERPNGSVRYTINVLKTERPKLRYGPKRIRATTRKQIWGARVGGGIHGYVRLRPPSGPARPGGYNFAFHNYFDGIGANGFFLGPPEIATIAPSTGFQRVALDVEHLRSSLANRIRGPDSGENAAVSAALITGKKAAIPEHVNEILRVSGLAHILSISGLHMALVAGTIMFAIRLGFGLAPNAAAKRPAKKIAAIAGFGAIAIYLFLAGASVATQRSFIMLAVMLGALMLDRAALTMRNLAIAAIVVIFIAPEAVLGPSFQMSFSATLALIAAYGAWQTRNAGRDHMLAPSITAQVFKKAGMFFGGLAMTSVIAGTATGVFAAYHFQRVAVLGLFGNLLAMPVVTLVTMPSAILGTLLIPVGLDGYAFQLMKWSVGIVTVIANEVAKVAPSGSTGAMSVAALMLMTTALFVLCLLKSKLRYLVVICFISIAFVGMSAERPLVAISEDGRLVGVLTSPNKVRVNRTRPNAFILQQWQAAYKAEDIIKPAKEEIDGFICKNKHLCTYGYVSSKANFKLIWIANKAAIQRQEAEICRQYDIIILAYAPAVNFCSTAPHVQPLVITAQNLALNGSAEIYQSSHGKPVSYNVRYAINQSSSMPTRPWQVHRKYSRSARNLAPYKRKKAQ